MSSKLAPLFCMLVALLLAGSATAVRAEESVTPPVVGQLLAGEARIDGVSVPQGATLLSGSLLTTQSQSASVHIDNGQLVELGSHSSARFQKGPGGEVEVRVGAGSLRFRAEDGNVRVAGPSDRVFFSQRRAGRPIYENQEGVVAVLAQEARRGSRQLTVSDASRVEPASELVVRTREGDRQELKCSIQDVRDSVITVGEDLRFGYGPEDLLVQRLPQGPSSVRARLSRPAGGGDQRLRVDDSKTINPLERIEIRHPDRALREVACVRFTQGLAPAAVSAALDLSAPDEAIGLFASLRNSYPADSEVVQGVRDAEVSTTLSQPASSGQRFLRVTGPESIDPLMQVVVRTAGGDHVEAYCVQAVEEDRVILAEELDLDYPAGSEVLQGRSAREAIASGVVLQRVANCCCCCDGRGGLVLPFAWWWFIPPAVLPILPQLPGDEPPGDAELPPTPIVP